MSHERENSHYVLESCFCKSLVGVNNSDNFTVFSLGAGYWLIYMLVNSGNSITAEILFGVYFDIFYHNKCLVYCIFYGSVLWTVAR